MTESGGGWYPDPGGIPGRLRWWDGAQWTDQVRDEHDEMASHPAGGPARNRTAVIVAGAVGLAVLLIVAVIVVNNGGNGGTRDNPAIGGTELPTDLPTALPTRPQQTIAPCDTTTPPSTAPPSPTKAPPAQSAPRITDSEAGISYAGQGEPWHPWNRIWNTPGLGATFATGYYIVTQTNTPGGEYFATVLSGTLTALVGDGPPADPRCVAQQLTEDVRDTYYPQPNTSTLLEAHPITASGHPGYLIRTHLAFDVTGYNAKGESVGILVLNVGRPQLAVLYISIPDTVRGFDYVFSQVLDSVRAP